MSETSQSDGKRSSSNALERASEVPRVLVVDDDKDLADTYAVWLSDRCEVDTAYGGVQARKRLDPDHDIVLLDRRMPGIPGDKVLEDIRDRGIDCQVAMLTAVEPDTDIIDLPFDEYLVKPVTQTGLREAVDDLLLRAGFGEEAQDYFSMESKSEALATRDRENLRDPGAADELQQSAEQARESERIQDLRDQLQRLQRITSVIRDIDKQLVVATSREEIERTTCERLVNADPYELAWIGDYTVTFEQATPRVAAGHDVSLDDDIVADGAGGPIAEAVSTGDVEVVDDLPEGPDELLAPISSAGEDPDFAAGAVVPLVYRDTVYGVLNVYTDEEDVFDEREVAVLSELGDSIANAINSVESKKLMLSDTVTELEFDIRDASDIFVSLSAETGAHIELKGFVPAADGALTSYLEVTGVTTETFLEAATDMAGVRNVRGISESSDQRLYECRVDDSTAVLSLLEAGANVESMQVDEGQGHIAAAVAPDTDVRTVVEALRENFEDVDLAAKRETERDLQSTEDFRKSLENRLTDRQYSVLQAAYSAGYFDWPRGSTAEEIAESLDLAPPTLHEHLRAAQKELMGVFFEETGEFD
jgi:predicted DNA binding protein/DNA-binding response OmpR family regulator